MGEILSLTRKEQKMSPKPDMYLLNNYALSIPRVSVLLVALLSLLTCMNCLYYLEIDDCKEHYNLRRRYCLKYLKTFFSSLSSKSNSILPLNQPAILFPTFEPVSAA